MAEIERAMFVVSGARKRLERTAELLAKDGADDHLVGALREAERKLDALSLKLMQKTYFAAGEVEYDPFPSTATSRSGG